MLKKNLVYVIILTAVLTAIFTPGFFYISPPRYIIYLVGGVCGLIGWLMQKILRNTFGATKFSLIWICCFGWILHCLLYSFVIAHAIKVIRIFFA